MLFPIAWVGRVFPWLRSQLGPVVRPIISPEWVHIVAHTALFAGLVVILAYALKLNKNGASVLFLLVVVLVLGLSQEGLQLVAKNRAFGGPEVFDLFVDLFGGILGIWIWQKLMTIKWLKFAA
ncbi:MAG: VanZ family protein [Chloroflexota bacterium]